MVWSPVLSLIYAAAFHYSYVTFLNPEFEYAAFTYSRPTDLGLALTYALIAAPVVAYRSSGRVASYGAELVYVVCYVPALLVILFTWQRGEAELAGLQLTLAASMFCILRLPSLASGATNVPLPYDGTAVHRDLATPTRITIHVLTAISTLMLVVSYSEYMQLVPLDDIYDLRFLANQTDKGVFSNYVTSFLVSCFLPYYFTRAILQKSVEDLAIAVSVSLLVYMAVGSKTALFMGPAVAALALLYGDGRDFLRRLLPTFTGTVAVALLFSEDDKSLYFLKTLVLVRIVAIGGWTMATYYEFFSNNEFTFYTHIGPVNALTGAYPYGDLSLGQVIGLRYTSSEEANFNANFWASDGIAAMGILGILFVTAALCAVFVVLNRIATTLDKRFVFLWLCGFWQGLLNVPLTTALLSGGGLLVMLFIKLDAMLRPAADALDAVDADQESMDRDLFPRHSLSKGESSNAG